MPESTADVLPTNASPAQVQAMKDKGVDSLYHLHDLHQRRIQYGRETGIIVAVWDNDSRFTVHLDSDGREPVGEVANIQTQPDGSLVYPLEPGS